MKENGWRELTMKANSMILCILATSLIICVSIVHGVMPFFFAESLYASGFVTILFGQLFLIVSLMMDEIKSIVALFGIVVLTMGIVHMQKDIVQVTLLPYVIAVLVFIGRMIQRSLVKKSQQ